ncbi:hypothetical protein NHP21005_12750 [Helicobacter sp. NHP21005]|nr:hypothetical protein NHP21005_12750 [Helicobacter sp. NHP21005]
MAEGIIHGSSWLTSEYKNPPVETFGQSIISKEVSKESRHGHLAQKDLSDNTTSILKSKPQQGGKPPEEFEP